MSSMRIPIFLFAILAFGASPAARADAVLDELEGRLAGAWLVRVDGENRTRTLKILGLDKKSHDVFGLDAEFGWSVGEKLPVQGEVLSEAPKLKMNIRDQAGGRISVVQHSEDNFSGTYAYKNGVTKGLKISRVTGEALAVIQKAELTAVPKIEQPSADVPPSCAAFLGGWTVKLGNFGHAWLWVTSVNAKCEARFYYGLNAFNPNDADYKVTTIDGGILRVSSRESNSTFEFRGNQLYLVQNHLGWISTYLMNRIQASGDSVAKIRIEQDIEKPLFIPPEADVPRDCAAFFGAWGGRLFRGNNPESYLRIYRVNSKCVVEYSHTTSKGLPTKYLIGEIKDGNLTLGCGNGKCVFHRKGDKLVVYWDGPAGTNYGEYKKME